MDTQLSRRLFVCSASIALILLGPAAPRVTAQAPAKKSAPTRPTSDPFRGYGVNASEGVLWGGGANFKVRFGRDEVEFTPALGRAAEHDLPVAFRTLTVGRGPEAVSVAAGEPRRVGAAGVEYDRAAGVVERDDVRADGLEVSYVFAERPAGTGDLVVRLQVRSELPGRVVGGRLRFDRAGVGGAGVGAVTGIDSQGTTAAGSVTLHGDAIDLSLPADFVDQAVFPLVLDPFIFPVIPVAPDPLADEGEPDVSWGNSIPGLDRFLVVWDKAYSLSDIDIRGQYIDAAGNIDPAGYWFIEVASNTLATRPQVASVPVSDRFMVVWEQRPSLSAPSAVYGRSIGLFGGASAIIRIDEFSAESDVHPDVGGHSHTPYAVVVWELEPGVVVWDRLVFVPMFSDPVGLANEPVFSDCSEPAISKAGGDSTHFLVAATSHAAGTPDHEILASLVDGLGLFVAADLITNTPGPDEHDPDVDGDGATFFVVFSRAPDSTSTMDSVYATRVTQSGSGLSTIETLIEEGPPFGDAQEPSVAFSGNGALVAWSEQFSGTDYDIPLVGLDPWANTIADPVSYADFEPTFAHRPAVCTKHPNDPFTGDGCMCTWQVTHDNGDDDVHACLVDPELGVVTNLFGQTALGGTASVSAATVGNPGFTHFYDGLYAFNSVTLLVGVAPLNAPFCTGTLVPNPIVFLALATGGDATLVLPTPLPPDPTLLGATLYEQYAESDPLTSPCGKKIQLSNGLSILIE